MIQNVSLQHLTWILGLKPSSGGTLKAMPTSEAPNLVSQELQHFSVQSPLVCN